MSALLTTPTLTAAAGVAGVAERTLRRWLSQKDFQRAYLTARRAAVAQATAALQAAASDAVQALSGIASDPTAATGARVSAARTILELAMRAVELDDLAARVEDLERQASAGG